MLFGKMIVGGLVLVLALFSGDKKKGGGKAVKGVLYKIRNTATDVSWEVSGPTDVANIAEADEAAKTPAHKLANEKSAGKVEWWELWRFATVDKLPGVLVEQWQSDKGGQVIPPPNNDKPKTPIKPPNDYVLMNVTHTPAVAYAVMQYPAEKDVEAGDYAAKPKAFALSNEKKDPQKTEHWELWRKGYKPDTNVKIGQWDTESVKTAKATDYALINMTTGAEPYKVMSAPYTTDHAANDKTAKAAAFKLANQKKGNKGVEQWETWRMVHYPSDKSTIIDKFTTDKTFTDYPVTYPMEQLDQGGGFVANVLTVLKSEMNSGTDAQAKSIAYGIADGKGPGHEYRLVRYEQGKGIVINTWST